MKHWKRATSVVLCGGVDAAGRACDKLIQPGAPVLVITIRSGPYDVERPRYRCASCAGESVPELPELVPFTAEIVQAPHKGGLQPIRALVPPDFKKRQAGD